MKTKLNLIVAMTGMFMMFSSASLFADEENTFKAIGKLTESPSNHTVKHNHDLQFIRLSDGKVFDIINSPELIKAHCQSEKNSVIEIEGFKSSKFLFWGGDLVVKNFKVHNDIEVSQIAHVKPESITRPVRDTLKNSRL